MSIPDLDLTARLVGLPLPELWNRYLAVGGSLSLRALALRIAGEFSWSPREDLFLAVALNDALIDESLVALDPLQGLRPAAVPDTDRRRCAADLEALRVRSWNARALARQLRDAAQEARRRAAGSARRPPAGQAHLTRSQSDRERSQRIDADRLDTLLEADAQIAWMADAAGRMLDSPTWRAFTGQSVAEGAGDWWLEAVHPADRRHAWENWHFCVAGDLLVRTHFRVWSVAAGEWRLTRVRAVPVHSARGPTSGWVGTNTVIGIRRVLAPEAV
jgi:PAS domain-containing protein